MLQIRVSDIGLALCAGMSVAGTSKVEGTISGCLGTNEIWHLNMILLTLKQRHFETAILILHNFFIFYYGY